MFLQHVIIVHDETYLSLKVESQWTINFAIYWWAHHDMLFTAIIIMRYDDDYKELQNYADCIRNVLKLLLIFFTFLENCIWIFNSVQFFCFLLIITTIIMWVIWKIRSSKKSIIISKRQNKFYSSQRLRQKYIE